MVEWFAGYSIYGISTLVGYLILNPAHYLCIDLEVNTLLESLFLNELELIYFIVSSIPIKHN